MTIPLEYELPLSRNGLSVTAFQVTPSIYIERWEKSAQIVLNIKKVQSTPSNPDPSYTHSYNYKGKQYGNQHVDFEPFENIRADNTSVRFEVLVTFRDKSWGWKKVDGMINQFGPIDKNAKASEVNVSVRIVEVGFFNGTTNIENKIRELLRKSNPDEGNDISENSNDEVKPNSTKPKTNSKTLVKKVKQRPKPCIVNGTNSDFDGNLDAKPFNPESATVDNTNNQNYDKMSNTSKNLSLKRKPIQTSSNKKINVKKPTPQHTPTPNISDQKSTINFNGRTISGDAECIEASTISFPSDDENYFLVILNLPPNSTSVNSNYYTNACTSCVAIQFQDLQQSKVYVATSGNISRNGNEISINVSVSDLTELIEGSGTRFQISGKISCDN